MSSLRPSLLAVELPGIALRHYLLFASSITVGRTEGNSILIEEESVSSRHCELRRNASGGYEIRDLGSTNGTRINGGPLDTDFHELYDGDQITLGPNAKIRFIRAFEISERPRSKPTKEETGAATLRMDTPSINPVAAAMAKAAKAKIPR